MPQSIVLQLPGNTVEYTPNTDTAEGTVVVRESLLGVTVTRIEAGKTGALHVGGVHSIVKATGAIDAGAPVYWNSTGNPVGGTAGSGAITTSSGGNTFAGWATAAALSGDERVPVLLAKSTGITVHHSVSNVIADPGDAGAIPVTQSGSVAIVTAGSETRTLAIPTFIGQTLALFIDTDGGTAVITVAQPINQTGNNTITMADVRDYIKLEAISVGGALRWQVTANDGAALSTVG